MKTEPQVFFFTPYLIYSKVSKINNLSAHIYICYTHCKTSESGGGILKLSFEGISVAVRVSCS
jgi:hypothetical protein